jgi:hypothetical protein
MKKSLPTCLLAVAAALTLSSGTVIADEWDHLAIMEKIDNARAELKQASAIGYEWRDSGKMLKQAETASASGDYAKAEKLIARAKQQAQLAVAQAAEQKHAGPR